ncbi:DUF2179 domain-containing protein [Clostridium thermarum]|uniref:DUF2179 domain-containing protein n=1 Tax=Clostridium thermarum TaxID=1716543 RepID=UPI00111F0328|nr:DUF5698 domain-containing protein [Clostridium thermarum]
MLTYLLIFISKILEVSLGTIRTVLLTRGVKLWAAIIGFFEVLIWLLVVGNVLDGIKEDPFRMFMYALGFASGNYIGSTIEEKLAIGIVTINITVQEKDSAKLLEMLRGAGLGVTTLEAGGINDDKMILITHTKRKRKNEIIKMIRKSGIDAMISISDTSSVYGGYGIKK